tara:strand:- start:299 stop:481 length:183 start_codon:yes stop_codon:yes gene_type:complete
LIGGFKARAPTVLVPANAASGRTWLPFGDAHPGCFSVENSPSLPKLAQPPAGLIDTIAVF